MKSNDPRKILERYRDGAIGTSDPDPKRANKSHNKMHKAYKELRKSQAGRNLILILLNDEIPHVRCWAAAHSLEWEPDLAKKTLNEIKDMGGSCSFDAEITLSEYYKGRLTFDY